MLANSGEKTGLHSAEIHLQQFEKSITDLGVAILKLKNEHQAADAGIASELEERYATLRKEYDEFKRSETQSSAAADTATEAWESAKSRFTSAYNDFKEYATSEETTQQWKKSAKDVGEGVGKAWSELASAFERAYTRLQEKNSNSADRSDRSNN